MMRAFLLTLGLATALAACGSLEAERKKAALQEEQMRSYAPPPAYCYQTIGEVACFAVPYHRDERRLVSFFGPSPANYRKPAPPEPAPFAPPAMIDYWVKDPEPMPTPYEPVPTSPPAVRKAPVKLVPVK